MAHNANYDTKYLIIFVQNFYPMELDVLIETYDYGRDLHDLIYNIPSASPVGTCGNEEGEDK